MRSNVLKTSTLEPNFSFAAGSATLPREQLAVPHPASPDSGEFHSDHSDFVLHKADPSLFNYRISRTEAASTVRVNNSRNPVTVQTGFARHCQSKWALYVTVALGLVTISACIAAGIALAAVRPYLIQEEHDAAGAVPMEQQTTSSTSMSTRAKDEQSSVGPTGTTDDYLPDLVTHNFTPARALDMQANQELRNVVSDVPLSIATESPLGSPTSSPVVSTNSYLVSDSDMAAPSMQDYTISAYDPNIITVTSNQRIDIEILVTTPTSIPEVTTARQSTNPVKVPDRPVFHLVETISEHDKRILQRQTMVTTPRTLPTVRTARLLIEDNREPDRFPDTFLLQTLPEPKHHNLNITFEDPYSHQRVPLLRRVVKRSEQAGGQDVVQKKSGPRAPLNLGKFTMMQPGLKSHEQSAEAGISSAVAAPENPLPLDVVVETKVLVPPKTLSGCGPGFSWNPVRQECVDTNECLQLGIRACGIHSECINTIGTYSCRCVPGYRLDPRSVVCLDIDECTESNGECSPLAICENKPGGFLCRCKTGFYGNGIICEVDRSSSVERIGDSLPVLPCQISFPPRSQQVISSPFYPEPFPVDSQYKFCVKKPDNICKSGLVVNNFLPSRVSFQDYDYLKIRGKVFTGTDINGQQLWLLDSNDAALEVEFSTDSDVKGNRFQLEISQEPCESVFTVPECAELLNVNGFSITSAMPHYLDNIACTTALYPPAEACGMELLFYEFSLEGPRETCPYDYLEINEDKMCGNMKNELREVIFPKATPKVPIIFSTDGSLVSVGFNITFSWILDCHH